MKNIALFLAIFCVLALCASGSAKHRDDDLIEMLKDGFEDKLKDTAKLAKAVRKATGKVLEESGEAAKATRKAVAVATESVVTAPLKIPLLNGVAALKTAAAGKHALNEGEDVAKAVEKGMKKAGDALEDVFGMRHLLEAQLSMDDPYTYLSQADNGMRTQPQQLPQQQQLQADSAASTGSGFRARQATHRQQRAVFNANYKPPQSIQM